MCVWSHLRGRHSTFRDPSHTAALLFKTKRRTLDIYKDRYNLTLSLIINDHAAPKVVYYIFFFFEDLTKRVWGRGWGWAA